MLIGYRTGYLGRPLGYGYGYYNYNYIHANRDYNMEKPFWCKVANQTDYLKSAADVQEVQVDEGEEECSIEDDVCYGRITINAVNFTKDGVSTEGFAVTVEKGCGSKEAFTAEQVGKAAFDEAREGSAQKAFGDFHEGALSIIN